MKTLLQILKETLIFLPEEENSMSLTQKVYNISDFENNKPWNEMNQKEKSYYENRVNVATQLIQQNGEDFDDITDKYIEMFHPKGASEEEIISARHQLIFLKKTLQKTQSSDSTTNTVTKESSD